MKRLIGIISAAYLVFSLDSYGQQLTNAHLSGSEIQLQWNDWASNYVVAFKSTIVTDTWDYVGNTVQTENESLVSTLTSQGFYRIRSVQTISFPDANLEAAVRSILLKKFMPTNSIYDIEVEGIGDVDIVRSGVTNLSGLEFFTSMHTLRCAANPRGSLYLPFNRQLGLLLAMDCSLTNITLSANTNLLGLGCSDNPLTNLNLSANTRLLLLRADSCNLTGTLDLSANKALMDVDVRENDLSEIIIDQTHPGLNVRHDSGVTITPP